jgi:shikimate kinase
MNLYLCGMIGSGKTTIGEKTAAETGLAFIDLDREMEKRLGYSFHKLVADKGWLAFRELEYDICKYFAGIDRHIVCLGGGTVRYQWNVDILKGTGPIVLLEASIETLIERVRRADRPRVNQGTTLEQDIEILWTKEKHKYHAAADLVYRSDEKSLDAEVADFCGFLMNDPRFQGILTD